jgi:hypothetical protein
MVESSELASLPEYELGTKVSWPSCVLSCWRCVFIKLEAFDHDPWIQIRRSVKSDDLHQDS